MSLKDRLKELATKAVKVKPVAIGEDTFFVRMMSGGQRSEFDIYMSNLNESLGQDKAAMKLRGSVLAATLCEEDGTPLFTLDDTDYLDTLPIDVVDPIFDEAKRLNKIFEKETIKGGE